VALVRPSWEFPADPREPYIHNRLFLPLSLAQTAAMLRQRGIAARVVDAHALRLTPDEVAALVRDCDQVFLTSSALDRWECPNTEIGPFVACARRLTREIDQVFLLGAHATMRPRELLALTGARGAVIGEPELAVVELADGRQPEEVAGLALASGDDLCLTGGTRPPLDLDAQPLPALDLLPLERYRHVLLGPRSVMLEGSRGCPHRCTTCLQVMYGPRYRRKSGERMVREVRFAVEEHGARNIVFIDMEFCLNRAAVEELCEFLAGRRYGLRWCCSTRADDVDRRLLRKMSDAGCRLIHYGVESGDQSVVDRLGKRLSLEQVEAAVRLTQEAGIEALAFFMFGLPGETWAQIDRTARFAERLSPDYVSYHLFTPYPCTPAFDALALPESPLFPVTTGEHDEVELRRFVRRSLLRFYLRPRVALRQVRAVLRRGPAEGARLLWSYIRG
jgi:anaerobic magnesium-protoporphyrin IX monomethyl ester cyclase